MYKEMISFLDLKSINSQYGEEIKQACARVIDSGWYIQGIEVKKLKNHSQTIVGQATVSGLLMA